MSGAKADHVCAFVRTHGDFSVIVVATRWHHRLCADASTIPLGTIWGDTAIILLAQLRAGSYRHILTGESIKTVERESSAAMDMASLTSWFPLAVLASRLDEAGDVAL